MQTVKQTREEKIAMYMKEKKQKIAEMLVNCNETLDAVRQKAADVYSAPNEIDDTLKMGGQWTHAQPKPDGTVFKSKIKFELKDKYTVKYVCANCRHEFITEHPVGKRAPYQVDCPHCLCDAGFK